MVKTITGAHNTEESRVWCLKCTKCKATWEFGVVHSLLRPGGGFSLNAWRRERDAGRLNMCRCD